MTREELWQALRSIARTTDQAPSFMFIPHEARAWFQDEIGGFELPSIAPPTLMGIPFQFHAGPLLFLQQPAPRTTIAAARPTLAPWPDCNRTAPIMYTDSYMYGLRPSRVHFIDSLSFWAAPPPPPPLPPDPPDLRPQRGFE